MESPLDQDLRRILALRHSNPHGVLGAHLVGDRLVIRVFRPEASQVIARFGTENLRLRSHPVFASIFEGSKLAERIPEYEVEASYPDGVRVTYKDPYAFLPTLGEQDIHFVAEGSHRELWNRLGAHPGYQRGVAGTSFAVWAPSAAGVSVVGDFNRWDGRIHQLRTLGSSGVWELFVPDVGIGARYKFELRIENVHDRSLKADPMAFRTELPPQSASIVHDLSQYTWRDSQWLSERKRADWKSRPLSIYEVHLGSWRRAPEDGNRPLTYRELAPLLADYANRLGFTHVELMPIAEHPFGGSWGYQVTSYYAPTSRYGHPDDFRYFVETLHQAGIGVIVDWVPAHFPRDAWALANFDGTALYEHQDPKRGAHPDWGTLIFNFGRNEVRNFLVANALFWIEEYHVDGLRVDAVASMLYLDYSRKADEWLPNRHGGRENEEAVAFLRELNAIVQTRDPGILVVAEESTSWPGVTRPVAEGGLGFTLKWNMGWMHDCLAYFQVDPVFRKHHHHQLTFGSLYAYTENFILPLSHDEVVHEKKSLLAKMPGDEWQRFSNLRALYAWQWSFPGKKLLFMGGEFGQYAEWNAEKSLDWHLLGSLRHAQLSELVRELNTLYRTEGSLHEADCDPHGFQWVQADADSVNVYAFIRRGLSGWREILCLANLSPVVRSGYRVGVPSGGQWVELLNTDAQRFGGSGIHNAPQTAEATPCDGQPGRLTLTLPPLAMVFLAVGDPERSRAYRPSVLPCVNGFQSSQSFQAMHLEAWMPLRREAMHQQSAR